MGSSLWAEITITGFLYLLASVFLCLRLTEVDDLTFALAYKDFSAVISVAAIAFSFLFGIIAHRIIPTIYRGIRAVGRAIRNMGKLKQANEGKDQSVHRRNLVNIWQQGSERVHRELDFQFTLLALFRSAAIGFLLLAASFSWWSFHAHYFRISIVFGSVFLALATFAAIAHRIQKINYHSLEQVAFSVVGAPNPSNRTFLGEPGHAGYVKR